jgi:hypothetical protein
MIAAKLLQPVGETTMRWCPLHQQAWCWTWDKGPQWIAVPWTKVWWAMQWARAGHCAHLIQVELTPCPQCNVGEEVA